MTAFDPTTINSFKALQTLLNDFVTSAGVTPGLAPHKVFWETMNYNEFVTGDALPGIPILVKGDAASSNLVKILSGPLTAFGIPEMPRSNPPYNAATPSQVNVVAGLTHWINANCPETVAPHSLK